MARQLRIQYRGAVHHITNRGNSRCITFWDNKDRGNFLRLLSRTVVRHDWLCHAYCLMNNHYHLLIETPDTNLSQGMKLLNQMYTQAFNWRHNRVGHLFQGRFKSILVEKESYLLEVCRYVVLNPVRADLVEHPSAWPWSSYTATSGLAAPPGFLTTDWVLARFSKRRTAAQRMYQKFVEDGMDGPSPFDEVRHQIFLGGDQFIEGALEGIDHHNYVRDVPREQRSVPRPPLKELFGTGKRSGLDLKQRNRIIHEAFERHGYTLREIGEFLELHPDYLSRINRKCRSRSEGRA